MSPETGMSVWNSDRSNLIRRIRNSLRSVARMKSLFRNREKEGFSARGVESVWWGIPEDASKTQAAMRVRPSEWQVSREVGLVRFAAVALAGWLWSCLWLLLASRPVQQLYQPEVDQRLACAYEGGTAEAI